MLAQLSGESATGRNRTSSAIQNIVCSKAWNAFSLYFTSMSSHQWQISFHQQSSQLQHNSILRMTTPLKTGTVTAGQATHPSARGKTVSNPQNSSKTTAEHQHPQQPKHCMLHTPCCPVAYCLLPSACRLERGSEVTCWSCC